MADLKQLKLEAEGFSVLYVEDNDKLRDNAQNLLKKIFSHVDVAADGAEGLAFFKRKKPPIVITDIKMPKMDGLEMASQIHQLSPKTEIIIMSAFDDKDNLFKSIELNVFRFLKKPVNVSELADVLLLAIKKLQSEQNSKLFFANLENVFNYQSSMVLMMKGDKPVFANQVVLDFFGIKDIAEGLEKYKDFGNLFLEHDGFLCNKRDKNWLEEIRDTQQNLYNVLLKDKKGNDRHFVLKYQEVPDKEDYAILSLDDVTELNLLGTFDTTEKSTLQKDTEDIHKFLEVIKRNHAKLTMHNFYKGLSITNDAEIEEIKDSSVIFKTGYMQQKAIQHEKQSLIVAEVFPHAVLLSDIANISFDNKTVEFKNLCFTKTSPLARKTVRVIPDQDHKVTLLVNNVKFLGNTNIEDISVDAVKLKLDALPAGLKKDDEVVINIALYMDKEPFILNTKAKLFGIDEQKSGYMLIFLIEYSMSHKKELIKYITKRQMAIIREFKGLNNG